MGKSPELTLKQLADEAAALRDHAEIIYDRLQELAHPKGRSKEQWLFRCDVDDMYIVEPIGAHTQTSKRFADSKHTAEDFMRKHLSFRTQMSSDDINDLINYSEYVKEVRNASLRTGDVEKE